MSRQIVIPFGPQHPVLPEPIHLDLVMEDERVVEAIPSIGYVHRGLEKLVEKREYRDFVYIAERICGICSFIHGMTYCHAVEGVMELDVPPRALYLRTVWSELSRLHSHLLWLGLMADAMGFESLFMQAWRLREHVLDDLESTTGNRVIQGVCKVGGVRRDVSNQKLREIVDGLAGIEPALRDLLKVFVEDDSIRHRLVGVGPLTEHQAWELGAVGPVLRASGVANDIRQTGYAAYDELDFRPVVETGGDCYARTVVRARELFTSIDLIRQAVEKIPDGPVETKVTGNPKGEFYARSEQPRGEVVHYVRANGTKHLVRFRVRTPTFTNIPPLLEAMKGLQLADVPVVVLSIDPCIGCAER
ncbi:MAG TPA: nickel-dependent hydrogenase large subunit [Methanoregulaceae archaeon]|nr:nickel-dependent hydrogenase large subunit [Methanoregulaceae archaeon]HQJ88698.1 nickel-dependent hydrogenase large subunit [Methanoregulaceae archaeon]